jgi:hypothetical protein
MRAAKTLALADEMTEADPELHTDLLELKAKGYLDSITLPALPARKEDNDG